MSVEDSINEALSTYKKRQIEYSGETWTDVGEITKVLYPDGIILKTSKDFARFHILQWLIGKLVRYARSNDLDSIKDAGVYSFILHHIVSESNAETSYHISQSQTKPSDEILFKPGSAC